MQTTSYRSDILRTALRILKVLLPRRAKSRKSGYRRLGYQHPGSLKWERGELRSPKPDRPAAPPWHSSRRPFRRPSLMLALGRKRSNRRFTPPHLFSIVEDMSKREFLGSLELTVLLTLIRLGDQAYGVLVAREIRRLTGRDISFGSLYSTLERLEGKGLVASELGEPTPQRGGRAKKYFRVTAKGQLAAYVTQQALKRLWKGLPQLQGRNA